MSGNQPHAAELAKNVTVPSGQLITIPASLGPTIFLEDDQKVRITLRTGCAVCFCLDASQVAASCSSSWAGLEYQSPSETAARSVKIKTPHHLIESAKGGCMYCCIIRAALDGVHPMWETEEPLIELFLAMDLPVILRLDFGISKTRTMNTDDAAALLGVVLHEGEKMQLDTTLVFPKPATEVEIYRPYLGASQDAPAGALKWKYAGKRCQLLTVVYFRFFAVSACAAHRRRGRSIRSRWRASLFRLHSTKRGEMHGGT